MCFMLGDAGGTAGPALRSHLDSQRRQSVPDPQSHPSPDNGAPPMTSRVRLPGRFRPRTAYRVAAAAAAIVTISALAACGSRMVLAPPAPAPPRPPPAPAGPSTGSGSCPRPGTRSPRAPAGTCTPSASSTPRSPPSTPRARSQAGLASSWKYAADGKSVTFQLRPGLKFTDGTAARRRRRQGEHRPRPDPGELDRGLGAVGHLQGRREQPDQLHPGPDPGRLPGARPARGQGRDDGQPGRVQDGRAASPPSRSARARSR